jgi:D-alanine-D-alanine ligase
MNVVILHGHVPEDATKDEYDVLIQVAAIERALHDLGFQPVPLPLTLDLASAAARLQQLNPVLVFNLVESVQGQGQYIHLGPTLLEGLRLPYTGATAATMFTTSNKLLTKKILASAGLATPPWFPAVRPFYREEEMKGPHIVKSIWEHGSIGLDDDAVVSTWSTLQQALQRREHHPAAPWYVERYIPGREFNLALLANFDGPELLPPAEIEFHGYPPGKVQIVGYRAKWDEESFEYQHTFRRVTFPPDDGPLLAELADLALRCWRVFELRGYARVDFRVDATGRPWVLEVNANPCLAPDSGFVAATEQAGYEFTQVVRRIIADACPAILPQDSVCPPTA